MKLWSKVDFLNTSNNKNPYGHKLMQWSKDDSHRGFLPKASNAFIGKAKNRSCGDEINLQLIIDDNKIISARYEGESCAISLASSGAICKMAEGKTLLEVSLLLNAHRMACCEGIGGSGLDDFVILRHHERRHNCATLISDAWKEIFASL